MTGKSRPSKIFVLFPHPFFFYVLVNVAYLHLPKLNPSTCAANSSFYCLHRDLISMRILQRIQAWDSNCSPYIPPLNRYSSLVSDPTTRLNLPKITKCQGIQNYSPLASPSMGLSSFPFLFYAFIKCYCLPLLFLVLCLLYILS